ncbi:MAG TPA: nitrilase-related carbon-nitrogen hydrolase [Acidisarcina sp.]
MQSNYDTHEEMMATATTHSQSESSRVTLSHPGTFAGSIGWLLAAIFLLFFADGGHTIPLTTWLAPLCLLRFVRAQPRLRGLAIAYAVLVVMRGISYHGMIPIPGIFYFIFMIISGVSAVMPYLADRFLTPRLLASPSFSPRLRVLTSTLVFPVVFVVTQFIYTHGPMGSWGSIAYTQSGNLALMQLLSITGIWGIALLIGLFASTANYSLELGLASQPAIKALAIFATALIAVLILGEARQTLLRVSSPTVRIASLSPSGEPHALDALLPAALSSNPTASATAAFETAAAAIQDDLFARTEREAQAGAKIILWSETAAFVLKQDEPALLARASALAARRQLYFALAIATWTPGADRPLENKVVMIEPTGNIAWQYLKARPTPGPEMAAAAPSDGKLRYIDTPYGRIVAAICYDMDFVQLMAQAGALKADTVLSPASDWQAIDPRHTEIASFRAVEQGFNLVRHANLGSSAAYDYQGHRLAVMDHFRAEPNNRTLVAEVPIRGTRTLYSLAGDWLAWLAIATLPLLIYLALRKTSSHPSGLRSCTSPPPA